MATPPLQVSFSGESEFNTFVYVFSICANAYTLFQIRQYWLYPATAESISLVAWGAYTVSSLGWVIQASESDNLDWGLWISSLCGAVLFFTVFLIGLYATLRNKQVLKKALDEYEVRKDQIGQTLKEAGELLFRPLVSR